MADSVDTRFTPAQKVWFGTVCLAGLLFAFVLAPFQGNDEFPHWVRAWSLARGDLRCNTLPDSVLSAQDPFPFKPSLGEAGKLNWGHVRNALDAPRRLMGLSHTLRGRNLGACAYWPLAYLVPALVVRTVALKDGSVAKGGMIRALWTARIVNWTILCLAVLVVALLLPWARNLVLAFFSIPEVIQQSLVLNSDLVLFLLMFAIAVAVVRRPSWSGIAVIALAVILMTVTKPIYALTGLVALPALVELWHRGERKHLLWQTPLAFLFLFVAPILLRTAWAQYVLRDEFGFFPLRNVQPANQIHFLVQHPGVLPALFWGQVKDTFSHELMRGSWRGILAAFGASAFELTPAGYAWMIVSILAALTADLVNGCRPPSIGEASGGTRVRWWAWLGAYAGVLVIMPAVVVAMYIYYSPWQADHVEGVQGRYHLIPLFWATMWTLQLAKTRWPLNRPVAGRLAGGLAACGAIIANVHALDTVTSYYWRF